MTKHATSPDQYPVREGWLLQPHLETFSGRAGPYYFRETPETPGVGFYAEAHHANLNGVVHGGALLTLADMALWDICRRKLDDGPLRGATVTLNSEFIGGGQIGGFIEATGEALKTNGSLLFARGVVKSEDQVLLNFSGTLKRFKPT